jgi:hypothetical protein
VSRIRARKAISREEEVQDDDQDPFPLSSPTSPQMPPRNPIPYPHPLAPSFSSSTRSTNISSASSYAVISPNELYSEDDGDPFLSPLMVSSPFLFVSSRRNTCKLLLYKASSNDTSDEDEVMIQPVHTSTLVVAVVVSPRTDGTEASP